MRPQPLPGLADDDPLRLAAPSKAGSSAAVRPRHAVRFALVLLSIAAVPVLGTFAAQGRQATPERSAASAQDQR